MEKNYVDGRVSIIMPIYNAEKYLVSALISCFNQTYKDIEIVLIDDCSKDNSAKIINEFKLAHKEIIYHLQEKNMGAGVARNKGLELATGRYVAFLDSDDVWKQDKIEKQLELMKLKNLPFCYTAIEMINENGEVVKPKRKLKETCDYKYLLRNTIIATSSVVIDRGILGDFKMSTRRRGQDYATWLKLLRDGMVAFGINEALVQYRLVKGSLSSNKFNSVKQVWQIQTREEKINKFKAFWHVICFSWNAFKKYIF